MSGVWAYILSQTQTPGRLLLFGGLSIGGATVLGSMFSDMTTTPPSAQDRRRTLQNLNYDGQRMVQAQEQRLSSMIKDMVDGQGDQHWSAVMRGTLMPHPNAENKTLAADNERAAKGR